MDGAPGIEFTVTACGQDIGLKAGLSAVIYKVTVKLLLPAVTVIDELSDGADVIDAPLLTDQWKL